MVAYASPDKSSQAALPVDLFGEPLVYGAKGRRVNLGWKPRAGNFEEQAQEELAAQCRSVLIDRLDAILGAYLPKLAKANGLHGTVYDLVLQTIQLALFPEEHAEGLEAEAIAELRRFRANADLTGLIPRGGVIERVGSDRFAAFAAQLLAGE